MTFLPQASDPPCARVARMTPCRRITLLLPLMLVYACTNPADIDVNRTITSSYVDTDEDDPRFDTLTAMVNTTIRFEASVDTSRIVFTRFTGSGLRIALLAVHPDSTAPDPFLNIYSVSANYLDLPATGLPFRIQIPAVYFKRFRNARVATALVVLFEDRDGNLEFNGEDRIFGICEQQIFGFAEGKRLRNIPTSWIEDVREGPNVLVRTSQLTFPGFRSVPDYQSTIFIIHVRGPMYRYPVPFPWPTRTTLTP